MAVGMILVAAPIQMIAGDAHGLNTLEHQPAKIAAIEGLWETEKGGTSLNLVGWPDMREERTKYALSVPHLGSLILTHTWSAAVNPWPERSSGARGPPRFDHCGFLELPHHGQHGPTSCSCSACSD